MFQILKMDRSIADKLSDIYRHLAYIAIFLESFANFFNLHLKECEFRRNMRRKDMYQELLKILREGA